jgi:hypothetical protein
MSYKSHALRIVLFIVACVLPFLLFKAVTGNDPSYHIKDERLERIIKTRQELQNKHNKILTLTK